MNVLAQIRNIEAAAQRMKADETRIQELEHRRQATADEIQGATKDLVLALAAQKGLLGLPPKEIAALFERIELPKAADAEGGRSGAKDGAVTVLQIGSEELADVTVEYTGYKRGRRVVLVQGIGLKRGGPNGFWSGRVDSEALAQLIQAFPDKVKVGAIHSQSKPAAAGASQPPEAVSEPSIKGPGADNLDPVAAQAREDVEPITTSISWPRPFPTLPRRVASSAIGDDEAK
jgi:hypothetical protein